MKEFFIHWKQWGLRVALYNVWFIFCCRTLGAKHLHLTKRVNKKMKKGKQ